MLGLNEGFFHNTFHLVQEFKTHEHYDGELLKLYTRVLFLEMPIPFLKKLITCKEILLHYLKHK